MVSSIKERTMKIKKNQNPRHNCRETTRTDVKNIVDSVNMTLHDYGIAFDFDEKENFYCVSDDVPSLLAQAQQEAVGELQEIIGDNGVFLAPKACEQVEGYWSNRKFRVKAIDVTKDIQEALQKEQE